jgi:hypothetical protein
MYLKQNYDLLVMFDLFNSISNIVLHCLCGKRFRNELRYMLKSMTNVLKNLCHYIWCCYFQINCTRTTVEPYVSYNATITRHESSNSSSSAGHNHLYLKIHTSPRPNRKYCCDCRWYFNRRPLTPSQKCCANLSKECLQKDRAHDAVQYTSLTQRSIVTRPTPSQSMRLYYPPQQTTTSVVNNKTQIHRH